MPIDEFGFAMLRGMGWTPGAQIGLNNRGYVNYIYLNIKGKGVEEVRRG